MATVPISYGYPDAAINAADLPTWQQPLARFTVKGKDDWKVSTLASLDRGLRVEAGTGSGDAVTDEFSAYDAMSVPKPDIASRWYLIARRRNWSGVGTTTLVAIPAGTLKELPAVGLAANQRRNRPGDESDHPLALVRVTQKDTTVQEVVDLRVWAHNGGVEAADKLALEFLNEPGAAVKIGSSTWRYERQANGNWGWKEYVAADATAPLFRHGFAVVWTNVDGFTTVPFDTFFPTTCLVAVGAPMNPPVNGSVLQFISAGAGGANFRCFDLAGNPLKSQRVGIGYIATGY